MINIRSSFDYSKDWPQTCLTFPRVKVIFEQLTTESTNLHNGTLAHFELLSEPKIQKEENLSD